MEFHIFRDSDSLAATAAEFVVKKIEEALNLRGRFTLALSGGSTPKGLFELLASPLFQGHVDWNRIFIFWSDERAVGLDHEWSNYRMARETLLSKVNIPESNIHRIQGELGAREAAAAMTRDLTETMGDVPLPTFDLILLGMGEDGHTASLFPESEALQAKEPIVATPPPAVPPNVERITMTFPLINNAQTVLFLVAGASKRTIVQEIMNNPNAVDSYPAACVEARETLWFLDDAALGK